MAQTEPLLVALQAAPAFLFLSPLNVPQARGIYLFSEQGTAVQVGQTKEHPQPAATAHGREEDPLQRIVRVPHRQADATAAGMNVERTLASLSSDVAFAELISTTRSRVRDMDRQFTEVHDPIVRTTFEMYVALKLNTVEYNSFETH